MAAAVARAVVDSGIAALRAAGGPDQAQALAYDVSHAAAAVRTAESVLTYGAQGDTEARIACAFVADALADLAARLVGRSAEWGVASDWMAPAEPFVATFRHPAFLASLAETQGERHLDADFELVRDTFHRFADEQIRPRAEHIHRANTDIPEEIISGMAEMGGFGMSVPEEYGGFAAEGDADYLSMVVATEELTWGSLGRRRLADHPARDPDPGHRQGRHRGAEAALAAPSSPPPRSWAPWPSPSPTSARTWPA